MPWSELPAHYGAGDVFAMPCRTRRGGLDVEGLGIVYLEASATGLPVVAGDSGGARRGPRRRDRLGRPGRRPAESADRIITLLADPGLRRRMGERGRAWVEEKWRWDLLADKLKTLL
ncbi:glycosyltransferase [Streptomyces sp. INA 01156]